MEVLTSTTDGSGGVVQVISFQVQSFMDIEEVNNVEKDRFSVMSSTR